MQSRKKAAWWSPTRLNVATCNSVVVSLDQADYLKAVPLLDDRADV